MDRTKSYRAAGIVLVFAALSWLVDAIGLAGSSEAPLMLAAALAVVGALMVVFELREQHERRIGG
jgi:spore maturation protein SpmB